MANTMVAAKAVDAEDDVVVAGEEDATPEDLSLPEVANIVTIMATVHIQVLSVTLQTIPIIRELLLQTCRVEAWQTAFDGVGQQIMIEK